MKYLQNVPIHKDDLFFIPAGTIHAIGAGALVAEIQESSNLTYRLYDYDRIGKDGKKRELHIDKALDVADLHGSAEPRQPLRVLKYRPGMASELLICWYAANILKYTGCLSMEYARKCNADLLLVSDSDCDRVGIAEHWGQTP